MGASLVTARGADSNTLATARGIDSNTPATARGTDSPTEFPIRRYVCLADWSWLVFSRVFWFLLRRASEAPRPRRSRRFQSTAPGIAATIFAPGPACVI